MRKHFGLKTIIVYSILQLPNFDKDVRELIDQMADMEIHFAMEDFSGKGRKFLEKIFKEASRFLWINDPDMCVGSAVWYFSLTA
jgi:hypothetical protein